MRIHCLAAILAIAMALLLKIDDIRLGLLIILIGSVLSRETQNSSKEDLIDLCCPNYHPKARDAKDKSAGAVLIEAIKAVVVGIIIFGPSIMAL